MHCAQCGNKVEDEVKFCNKCGSSVELLNKDVSGAAPSEPRKSKTFLVGIVSVLAFIIAFGVGKYITQEAVSTFSKTETSSKQEIIDQSVREVRSSTVFPSALDEVTTWTGITGNENGIRYQYTLHDIDESQVSNLVLKNMLTLAVCQNVDTRSILDAGINMEYSYAVLGSSQNFFVSVSELDCK
jgi:hypothetical protein